MKILIVDDEPDTVAFLTMLFEDNGYAVVSTTNPNRVLDLIREESPDLVTLDLLMPNKTGVRVYRELRTHEYFAGLPVVVISGANQGDYIPHNSNGNNSPVQAPDAFIEKPVDSFVLLETVRRLTTATAEKPL
jgi:CheY-like chemotaxis protein